MLAMLRNPKLLYKLTFKPVKRTPLKEKQFVIQNDNYCNRISCLRTPHRK